MRIFLLGICLILLVAGGFILGIIFAVTDVKKDVFVVTSVEVEKDIYIYETDAFFFESRDVYNVGDTLLLNKIN